MVTKKSFRPLSVHMAFSTKVLSLVSGFSRQPLICIWTYLNLEPFWLCFAGHSKGNDSGRDGSYKESGTISLMNTVISRRMFYQ